MPGGEVRVPEAQHEETVSAQLELQRGAVDLDAFEDAEHLRVHRDVLQSHPTP
jgi:hypothetical protein